MKTTELIEKIKSSNKPINVAAAGDKEFCFVETVPAQTGFVKIEVSDGFVADSITIRSDFTSEALFRMLPSVFFYFENWRLR